MGLPNVDFDKLDPVAVFSIELSETHGPIRVGRSGEAAEDEGDWLLALEVRQTDGVLTLDIFEFKVRCGIAYLGCQEIIFPLPGCGLLAVLDGGHHRLSNLRRNISYHGLNHKKAEGKEYR